MPKQRELGLHQQDVVLAAFLDVLLWPDACLHLSDMRFLQEEHAQSALTDTAAD